MREPIKTFNEDEERQFKASHTFKDFTYWNLDTPPTENDHIKKAMKWFDLANVVSSYSVFDWIQCIIRNFVLME